MADLSLDKNSVLILKVLGKKGRTDHYLTGPEIAKVSDLTVDEINRSVDTLVSNRFIETLYSMGTAPYFFHFISITSRGLYELERIDKTGDKIAGNEPKLSKKPITLPPSPVGSPYGFTIDDWEIVAERKVKNDELRVVFGCQFNSAYYDTALLNSNVELNFKKAVDGFNRQLSFIKIDLHFQPLGAGYGEHLFNEIAREIISSDIAVFDTSDLNSNVMIEMGVALTWGVFVLPIKREGCPKPPSDISGQTWTDYRNNAAEFVDPTHDSKLLAMVSRAARKKGKKQS